MMFCSRPIRSGLVSMLGVVAMAGQAGTGLQPPSTETLWPSLQARISIQSNALPAIGLPGTSTGWLAGPQAAGLRGGAVYGDYYFARPGFGQFRATSGLLVGAQAGAPQAVAGTGSRLGFQHSVAPRPLAGIDTWSPLPYLGLGFTRQAASGGWSLTADLGVVAEKATDGGLRRALGVQGVDNALRELRLSPVLQLGWRSSF